MAVFTESTVMTPLYDPDPADIAYPEEEPVPPIIGLHPDLWDSPSRHEPAESSELAAPAAPAVPEPATLPVTSVTATAFDTPAPSAMPVVPVADMSAVALKPVPVADVPVADVSATPVAVPVAVKPVATDPEVPVMPVVVAIDPAPAFLTISPPPLPAATPAPEPIPTPTPMTQSTATPIATPVPQAGPQRAGFGTMHSHASVYTPTLRDIQQRTSHAPRPLLSLRTQGYSRSSLGEVRRSYTSNTSRSSLSPHATPVAEPIPQSFAPPLQGGTPQISEPVPQSFAPPLQGATPQISEPIPQSFAPEQPLHVTSIAEPVPQSFAPPLQGATPQISEPVPQSFASEQPLHVTPIAQPIPQSFAPPQQATPVPTCMVIDDADFSLTYEMDDNDNSYAPIASVVPEAPAANQKSILAPDVMINNDISASHILNRLEKTNVGMLGAVHDLPDVPSGLPSVINHDVAQVAE